MALTAVLISTLIGVAVGAYAGYYGGWVDSLLMRFVDFMLTIPFLPLLLILSSMLLRNENLIPIPEVILRGAGAVMLLDVRDARQAVIIIIVLAATGWLQAARLMRGTVLSLRNQTFTEAARAMGASNGRIILSHMIPNSMAPIIVDATLAPGGVHHPAKQRFRSWASASRTRYPPGATCSPPPRPSCSTAPGCR